jgi:hypothetical protein
MLKKNSGQYYPGLLLVARLLVARPAVLPKLRGVLQRVYMALARSVRRQKSFRASLSSFFLDLVPAWAICSNPGFRWVLQ